MIPVTDPSKQIEQDRLAAEVAEFLAKGGQVERLRQGQMAHNAPRRTALPDSSQVTLGVAPTPPESVPITGVHRIPNTRRHEPPQPRTASAGQAARETRSTPSPTPKRTGNFKGRPPSVYVPGKPRTKCDALRDALAAGWQSAQQLADATHEERGDTLSRLWVLRHKGLAVSHGARMNMKWAAPGTVPPDDAGEFDGDTTEDLQAKYFAATAALREAKNLLARIVREEQRRKSEPECP